MSISFFRNVSVSGLIRGTQIANYIGAKINPKYGFENDVCIFVKKTPRRGEPDYYDIIDSTGGRNRFLNKHPETNIIAISQVAFEYLSEKYKNNIVLIPQHHCNFNKELRPEREVKVAGWCGAHQAFYPFEDEIREKLKKIGIELRVQYNYKKHEDVVRFYKEMDIQIAWRVSYSFNQMLKNPLKLSNAGSFGIPTIAMPEPNFMKEYNNYFFSIRTINELVHIAYQLKLDQNMYNDMAKKCMDVADRYHISNIAKLYKKLDKCE